MNKIIVFLTIALFSCNESITENKTINNTKVEISENEYYFGNATLKDTINHTFKIKNITNTDLIINNIASSCGCTTVGEIDSVAKFNETIDITVQFIPKKEQQGKISNSVVVEMNTEKPFTILRLKGEVVLP